MSRAPWPGRAVKTWMSGDLLIRLDEGAARWAVNRSEFVRLLLFAALGDDIPATIIHEANARADAIRANGRLNAARAGTRARKREAGIIEEAEAEARAIVAEAETREAASVTRATATIRDARKRASQIGKIDSSLTREQRRRLAEFEAREAKAALGKIGNNNINP